MVTRFYFDDTAAAPVSPAFGGSAPDPWNDTSLAIRRALLTAKVTESLANGPTYTFANSLPNQQRLSAQFVSAPLAAGSITHTGTFQVFVAGGDSLAAVSNVGPTLKLWVVSNDGSTVRGRLWTGNPNTTPFSGSYLNASALAIGSSGAIHFNDPTNGNSGSDLTIQAGDRIVVEIGLTGSGANGSQTSFQQFGANTSLGDFSANGQSNLDGWIELSQTLAFIPGIVAPFTAGEIAAIAQDKPMWIGNNILEINNPLLTWRASRTLASGADITDPNAPVRRARNRIANAGTSPTNQGGGVQNYHLLSSPNPGTGGRYEVDMIVIEGHNLGDLDTYAHAHGGAITVTAYVAADNAFSSSFTTLATITGAPQLDNRRIVAYLPIRYSQVSFIGLTINTTAPDFGGSVPVIGELVFGRRRLFAWQWDRPYDGKALESDFIDVVPKSRAAVRYGLHGGARDFDMTWVFASGGLLAPGGLVQENEARSLWVECDYGRRSVIFIPNPLSAPQVAYRELFKTKDLKIPFVDAGTLSMSLQCFEVSPFMAFEQLAYANTYLI